MNYELFTMYYLLVTIYYSLFCLLLMIPYLSVILQSPAHPEKNPTCLNLYMNMVSSYNFYRKTLI